MAKPHDVGLAPVSWERMIRAVERVRERLSRATAALQRAGIPYAVIGGNAVKDRTHLRDLIDVGLLDDTWCERLPPELSDRLRRLLEDPDG